TVGWIGASTRDELSTTQQLTPVGLGHRHSLTSPKSITNAAETESPQHPPDHPHSCCRRELTDVTLRRLGTERCGPHHTEKTTAMQDPPPPCRCNITLHLTE